MKQKEYIKNDSTLYGCLVILCLAPATVLILGASPAVIAPAMLTLPIAHKHIRAHSVDKIVVESTTIEERKSVARAVINSNMLHDGNLTDNQLEKVVLGKLLDMQLKKNYNDVPEVKSFQFADPATLPMEKMAEFHFFLILLVLGIAIFVILFLSVSKKKFNYLKNIFKMYGQYPIIKKKKKRMKKLLINLEIIGTLIPLTILSSIASPSFAILYEVDATLEYNNSVKVIGHQWYGTYEIYDMNTDSYSIFDSYMLLDSDPDFNNMEHFRLLTVDKPLEIQVEIPTLFLATADDVIHSWAVPAFGIKMDTVPGRINQFNISIIRPSLYHGQCSEICGPNHPFMPIVVEAKI